MNRVILAVIICGAFFVAGAVPAASPEATPPTAAQLKAKIVRQANLIADKNETIANLRDERDAQDAVIADQNDTITRLRARDPLDAITARNADGQWAAMLALWRAFPSKPEGALCGYDKSTRISGLGLTLTSYQFDLWQGC